MRQRNHKKTIWRRRDESYRLGITTAPSRSKLLMDFQWSSSCIKLQPSCLQPPPVIGLTAFDLDYWRTSFSVYNPLSIDCSLALSLPLSLVLALHMQDSRLKKEDVEQQELTPSYSSISTLGGSPPLHFSLFFHGWSIRKIVCQLQTIGLSISQLARYTATWPFLSAPRKKRRQIKYGIVNRTTGSWTKWR